MSETSEITTKHHQETIQQLAQIPNTKVANAAWTTESAKGLLVFTFVGFETTAELNFTGDVKLHFKGDGWLALGAGGSGSLDGTAVLNVDPNSLRGASVNFSLASAAIGVGGYTIQWFRNGEYVGTATFTGVGFQLTFPFAGGSGTFE
jgi:hypothetical protein